MYKKRILSTIFVFAMLVNCIPLTLRSAVFHAEGLADPTAPTHLDIHMFLSKDTDWRTETYHPPEINSQEIGSKIYFGAYFVGSSAGDIEVLSSDESVIAWTEGKEVNSYVSLFWPDENNKITRGFLTINGYLNMKKAGKSTITFRSKSNPNLETKYCIGVKDPNSTCPHEEGEVIPDMDPTSKKRWKRTYRMYYLWAGATD